MDSVSKAMEECTDTEARVVDKQLTVQINAGILARKLGHDDCIITAAEVKGGQVVFHLSMRPNL